jgi:hypothetical protein
MADLPVSPPGVEADISLVKLDDLMGQISLMLPKFGNRLTPQKKWTSWACAQERKPKGWKSIATNLTTVASEYPTLGCVSLSRPQCCVRLKILRSRSEILNLQARQNS